MCVCVNSPCCGVFGNSAIFKMLDFIGQEIQATDLTLASSSCHPDAKRIFLFVFLQEWTSVMEPMLILLMLLRHSLNWVTRPECWMTRPWMTWWNRWIQVTTAPQRINSDSFKSLRLRHRPRTSQEEVFSSGYTLVAQTFCAVWPKCPTCSTESYLVILKFRWFIVRPSVPEVAKRFRVYTNDCFLRYMKVLWHCLILLGLWGLYYSIVLPPVVPSFVN